MFKKLLPLFTACALAGAAFADDAEVEPFYIENKLMKIEAQELEANENYTKAAKKYHRLATQTKNYADKAGFFLKEADNYFLANKTHQAMEAYQNVVKGYALYIPFDHVVARIRELAEKYVQGDGTFLSIKDRESAIKAYFLLITEAPAIHVSLDDRLRLARLLVEADRKAEAVVVYQEILKLNSRLDDVHLELAMLLVDICKYGDGDGAIRRSAERHAKLILAHNPNYERKEEVELILTDAREVAAERILDMAKFYLRSSHLKPKAAKMYLIDLIQNHADTKAALEAKCILDENPHIKKLEESAEDKETNKEADTKATKEAQK